MGRTRYLGSTVGALGVVLAVALCGCSSASSTSSTSNANTSNAPFAKLLPASFAKGHVSDVTEFNYPPYDYTSPSGAEIGGEVTMLNDAAKLLGVKMTFTGLSSWSAVIPALVAGKYDMSGNGIGVTAARLKEVSYVQYGSIGEALLAAKVIHPALA